MGQNVDKEKPAMKAGFARLYWIPAFAGMTFRRVRAKRVRAGTSLDLAFLVDHVLAHDRIVLLELELFRGVLLVLLRGVEVAGAGRRDHADLVLGFVGHDSFL